MKKPSIVSLLPAAALTATGAGDGVDIREFEGEAFLVLDASAEAESTLDVTLEQSDDGEDFEPVASVEFEQVTDAAASFQTVGIQTDGLGPYVRAVATVAGTSVVCSLSLVGRTKY